MARQDVIRFHGKDGAASTLLIISNLDAITVKFDGVTIDEVKDSLYREALLTASKNRYEWDRNTKDTKADKNLDKFEVTFKARDIPVISVARFIEENSLSITPAECHAILTLTKPDHIITA